MQVKHGLYKLKKVLHVLIKLFQMAFYAIPVFFAAHLLNQPGSSGSRSSTYFIQRGTPGKFHSCDRFVIQTQPVRDFSVL